MARAPTEEPEGIVYEPELLSVEEEAALLGELETLRFDPIVLHERAAKRPGRHFGLDCDHESRTPKPGEPVPDWLLPVRARAASGETRRSWEHSIPPTKELRHSITFRTLRNRE